MQLIEKCLFKSIQCNEGEGRKREKNDKQSPPPVAITTTMMQTVKKRKPRENKLISSINWQCNKPNNYRAIILKKWNYFCDYCQFYVER